MAARYRSTGFRIFNSRIPGGAFLKSSSPRTMAFEIQRRLKCVQQLLRSLCVAKYTKLIRYICSLKQTISGTVKKGLLSYSRLVVLQI
jgi:hypothetical protein